MEQYLAELTKIHHRDNIKLLKGHSNEFICWGKLSGIKNFIQMFNFSFLLLVDITEGLDQNEVPIGFFLDLSKAFDCVNHQKIFSKLEFHLIRDNQLELLRSFLNDRTQARETKFTRTKMRLLILVYLKKVF